MSTILPDLQAQINKVIANIPPDHLEAPVHGTAVTSPQAAYEQVQDWAFSQGYAFAIESATDSRVRFECIHHKEETKNCRKLQEEEKSRPNSHIHARGCKYMLYVS